MDDLSELLLVHGFTPECIGAARDEPPPPIFQHPTTPTRASPRSTAITSGWLKFSRQFHRDKSHHTAAPPVLQMLPRRVTTIAAAIILNAPARTAADCTEDDTHFRGVSHSPPLLQPESSAVNNLWPVVSSTFEVRITGSHRGPTPRPRLHRLLYRQQRHRHPV